MNYLDDEGKLYLLQEITQIEKQRQVHKGKAKIKQPRTGRQHLLDALHSVSPLFRLANLVTSIALRSSSLYYISIDIVPP